MATLCGQIRLSPPYMARLLTPLPLACATSGLVKNGKTICAEFVAQLLFEKAGVLGKKHGAEYAPVPRAGRAMRVASAVRWGPHPQELVQFKLAAMPRPRRTRLGLQSVDDAGSTDGRR